MISHMDPTNCVVCGNGEWKDKIYHFLPHMQPSSAGNEIQSEYFVKKELFKDTLEALYNIRHEFKDLVQCTEIREIKGDSINMSPAHGKGNYIGIHFTWYKNHHQVLEACRKMEKAFEPFNVKPHVGKAFVMSHEAFKRLYGDDLTEIQNLIKEHDPYGKFGNEYIDTYIMSP
jgi:alditol oxidase